MEIFMERFAERFKALRVQSKLSQAEMAKYLGFKDGRSIRQYERAEVEPTLLRLITMAQLFHVSIDYLAGISEDKLSDNQTTLLTAFDRIPVEKQMDAIKLLMALQ